MTAFLKKHWPWLLLLALLIVWICESSSATATKIRAWFQQTLGNAFTGFAELAAVVVITFIVVVLILDLPVFVFVAVAVLVAYAAWKLLGWFAGLFGATPSAPNIGVQPSSPAGTTGAPAQLDANYPSFNPSDFLTYPAGTVTDPQTGLITLPDGRTFNGPNTDIGTELDSPTDN